jgi:uncharacterized protein
MGRADAYFNFDNLRRHSSRQMKWETAHNAIREFLAHCQDVKELAISFWGGEPLLNFPLIRRVVEYIRKECSSHQNIAFNFTTNASLITQEISDFLVQNDFRIMVSLDGPQHIHDQYRVTSGGQPTFQKTMAGLLRLRKSKQYYEKNVHFNCVLTPKTNFSDVLSFFSNSEILSEQQNVNFTMVTNYLDPFFQKYGNYSLEQVADLRNAYIKAVRNKLSFNKQYIRLFERDMVRLFKRPRTKLLKVVHPNGCCIPLLKKMHVDIDGNIHLCERVPHCNPLGNVNANGIDFAAVVELIKEYTENSLNECRHCWAVRLCSACFLYSIKDNKWHGAIRNANCEAVRQNLLSNFRVYSSVLETSPRAFDYLKDVSISGPN